MKRQNAREYTERNRAAIYARARARVAAEPRVVSDHECECGCGRLTEIARRTTISKGAKKGEPLKFVRGHYAGRSESKLGARNPQWLGEKVSDDGGRLRARRRFSTAGGCSECGAPKAERHHIDGNTQNNDQSNIAILCRRCHMVADGRLTKFLENRYNPKNSKKGEAA